MKLKKIDRRGQSIATDKLVIWIIVILVVASVAIFLFKADILNWIRNLPSYKVPGSESAGGAGEGTEVVKEEGSVGSESSATSGGDNLVKIAKVKENRIYFCEKSNCKEEELIESDLYISGDINNKKIVVDMGLFDLEDVIGTIKNSVVELNPLLENQNSQLYREVKKGLPIANLLSKLDGSRYCSNEIYLCMEEVKNE
ncbi:MAG: hypothetical protein KKA64_01975 [Nanoarchaeota archaeon]|nr:hypothetical protein [Nanoarchaeota archaeon]